MTCRKSYRACEPELADVLDDPLIQAMMARDGVDRDEIEHLADDFRLRAGAGGETDHH